MATVEVRQCDVFGTTKNVSRYRVVLAPLGDGDEVIGERINVVIDLSPRASDRLDNFIHRGLVSPAQWEERNKK